MSILESGCPLFSLLLECALHSIVPFASPTWALHGWESLLSSLRPSPPHSNPIPASVIDVVGSSSFRYQNTCIMFAPPFLPRGHPVHMQKPCIHHQLWRFCACRNRGASDGNLQFSFHHGPSKSPLPNGRRLRASHPEIGSLARGMTQERKNRHSPLPATLCCMRI